MYALKEKVSERLSRLFSDSATSSSSSSSSSSSTSASAFDHPQPQVRPYYKGVNSLASLFSLVAPSASLDASGSNKHQNDLKPIHPRPVNRSDEGFEWQYDFDNYEYFTPSCKNNSHEEDKDFSPTSKNKETVSSPASGTSTSDSSDVFEEAPEGQSEPQSPEKHMRNLTNDSVFISPELYEFLQSSLPNIVKGCQWVLLYSTLKHGISLRTLIRKSADLPGPCLLIMGDMQGAVFGGLLQGPLNPTAKRKYQGTIQTFVFTTIYGEPRLFRPTGANRYFYLCLNDLLALGGGGNFALCLDGDLLSGTSGPCDTFGNLCLAHNPEFELKNVELWGFTHASQYLK